MRPLLDIAREAGFFPELIYKADERFAKFAELLLKESFTVRIGEMEEVHQTTHWVQILNNLTRPEDATIFDNTGYITPYMSVDLGNVEHCAGEWADFLGTTVEDSSEENDQ